MDLEPLLRELERLPQDWHGAGMITVRALRRIARHGSGGLSHSAETGSGRSTLLLSHLSEDHLAFSVDAGGSLSRVRSSPLLRTENVRFVEGPSQLTVPQFRFDSPLDLVLLDGSHSYPGPDIDYFYLYPHIAPGGLLIVDDIHIPMIASMFRFLKEDDMWLLVDVAAHTAFFRRSASPTFDRLYGDWFLQGYNARHFPFLERMKMRVPQGPRRRIRAILDRR